MAKLVKLQGLLRFQDSDSEPRTKKAKRSQESLNVMRTEPSQKLSPFQRAKQGAGEMFLAAEVIPDLKLAN